MECRKYKLLMVDDDPAWLSIVSHFLEETDEFDLTTCGQAAAAIELAASVNPDIVLLDLDLGEPDRTGIDLIPELVQKTKAKIVMFTVIEDRNQVEQAILAGAVDYAVKAQYKETLLPVIRRAMHHFSADVIASALRRRNLFLKLSSLTKTERGILRDCHEGKSPKTIQEEMKYEKQSYWNCVGKIKKKLQVNSMKEAVDLIKKNL